MDVDLTRMIAVYGAALSTATAAWNARQQLLDRGRLWTTFGFDGRDDDGIPIVTLRITNVGRRPIMLAWMRQEWADGHHLDYQFDTMLEPGRFYSRNIQDAKVFADLEAVFVFDSTGKRWRVPRREIDGVKQRYRDMPSSP